MPPRASPRATPRPSSATVTSTVPPRCSARSSRRPRAGLPARSRSCGGSIPWAIELRSRWTERLGRPSRIARSSSVSAPTTISSTSLPVSAARSRTARGSGVTIDDERQRPHPDRRVLEPVEQALRRRRARRRRAVARLYRSSSRARARDAGGAGRSHRRGRAACRSSRPARGSSGSRPAAPARWTPAPARGPRRRARSGAPARRELRDQRGGRLAVALDVPAEGVGGAQQGIDERRPAAAPRWRAPASRSSATCASALISSSPTMPAAPLIVWVSRNSESTASGAALPFSSASSVSTIRSRRALASSRKISRNSWCRARSCRRRRQRAEQTLDVDDPDQQPVLEHGAAQVLGLVLLGVGRERDRHR